MSRQHFDEGSPRKYTLTVFLSFAVIFCFVMLMKLWQGDFKPEYKIHPALMTAMKEEGEVTVAVQFAKSRDRSEAQDLLAVRKIASCAMHVFIVFHSKNSF